MKIAKNKRKKQEIFFDSLSWYAVLCSGGYSVFSIQFYKLEFVALLTYYWFSIFVKQWGKSCRISISVKNIVYTSLCINPNFNHINLSLLINLFKTLHKYSSLNSDFPLLYYIPFLEKQKGFFILPVHQSGT